MNLTSQEDMTPKILVADDHPMVRKGISMLVKQSIPDATLIEATNGHEALILTRDNSFDLFILDYRMPGMDGYSLAKRLLGKNPLNRIIIFTTYSAQVLALKFIDAGVRGFVSKSANPDELQTCIIAVMRGNYYFSQDVLDISQITPLNQVLPAIEFTKKELDLAKGLSLGLTSKEISESTGLSIKTIETYRLRLHKKTHVSNTSELISYLYQIGQLEI